MDQSVPLVMIMHPHLSRVESALGGDYAVVRAWENPTAAELARVRVVVIAGAIALDTAALEALPALGLIACFTTGYDGVDLEWVRARGLQFSHAPGVNEEDVADHALGLILAARRRLIDGDRRVRTGEWRAEDRMLTPSLRGRRVGVVGLGRIGEAVARRCDVMLMPVSWWGPRDHPETQRPRAASLLDLAQASDILVVACRADAANRGLIDAAVIHALGREGLLVNVARGQLVDEDALITALRSGALGGAALDVFQQEPTAAARWADVPNTVLTPHTAGATFESVSAMLELLKLNLATFFATGAVATPVGAAVSIGVRPSRRLLARISHSSLRWRRFELGFWAVGVVRTW